MTRRAESCVRETSAASTRMASSGSPAGPSGSQKSSGCAQNLDEIESVASAYGPVAATDGGHRIVLWREANAGIEPDDLRRAVARRFGLNPSAFAVRKLDELPRTASGKIDYERLAERDAR